MGPSLAIYRELARGAEEYHVLAASASRSPLRDREDNLTLHLLPFPRAREFALAAYWALFLVRRHRINAIVCQDPLLGGLAGVHVGRVTGIPVMVELHTDGYFAMLDDPSPRRRVAGRAAAYALRQADRVRASTPTLGLRLRELGVAEERIADIPYRVDTGFFAPLEQRRRAARAELGLQSHEVLLLSVGRFVPQKGYPLLVDAFREVLEEQPAARLLLAGGGPQWAELHEACADAAVTDAVTLRGWVSREEQRSLLAAADIYVQASLPGLGEWMPRTILEAMASGKPVVASGVGGIGDIVGPDHGELVPAGQRGPLVAALSRLAREEGRRAAMAESARSEAVARYEWSKGFATYRDVIAALA